MAGQQGRGVHRPMDTSSKIPSTEERRPPRLILCLTIAHHLRPMHVPEQVDRIMYGRRVGDHECQGGEHILPKASGFSAVIRYIQKWYQRSRQAVPAVILIYG